MAFFVADTTSQHLSPHHITSHLTTCHYITSLYISPHLTTPTSRDFPHHHHQPQPPERHHPRNRWRRQKPWFGHRTGWPTCAHSISKRLLRHIVYFPFRNFRPRLTQLYLYVLIKGSLVEKLPIYERDRRV